MDTVLQYVLSLAPAISASISIIVALIVGVRKMRKSSAETEITVKQLKKENKELRSELKETTTELKAIVIKLNDANSKMDKIESKIRNVHVIEKRGE